MDHVPLAIFVNGLLSAFNELRHCAPLSLGTALASILQVKFEANICSSESQNGFFNSELLLLHWKPNRETSQ